MGVTRGRASRPGRATVTRYRALWTRQGQRILIAATLALLTSGLLLLADAAGAIPAPLLPHTPLHAGAAHAYSFTDPTATATTAPPTATSVPKPPGIRLLSPSSSQGPVGAHVTISGHDFSGSTATIFAALQGDCSGGSQGTLVTPNVSGGSFGKTAFIWPTNLNNGTYYICADGMTSGAPAYQVIAFAPPTLSLSVSTASAGDSVTVTGTNFAGYPSGTTIKITESSGGTPLTLTDATLGGDGSFTVSETLSKSLVGNNVTINAFSPAEATGIQPVLQASASLTVQGSTPTPTITVTPTQVASGGGTPTPTPTKSSSLGLIIVLIVGIVLALLVILGVVAYLVLRGRNNGPNAGGGYPGDGGYGGYGGTGPQRATGPVPGYGQSATGRYAQVSPYGRLGVHDTPDAYTEPFGSPPVGGVSQWDEPEPAPDPDWQPRPMTGYGPAGGNDPQYDPYSQYPDYPAAPAQQPVRKGTYPPVDPWETPPNQPGRGTGAGYPPPANYGGAPGRTRATGPTGAGPQPRPQPQSWGNEPGSGGWDGSGATRPGQPGQWDQPPGNEPGW